MTGARLHADFNGLFGDILCLSHGETCKDEFGNEVRPAADMTVTVYEDDAEEGRNRDDLWVSGRRAQPRLAAMQWFEVGFAHR